jgi:signal peptidase II
VALDRATKLWASGWLRPRVAVPVAPFFHLTYVENTGAAWGMLRGANLLLSAVSVVLTGFVLAFSRRRPREDHWLQYGSTMVVAGALGNLYDRLVLGCVVDFLDFRVWPVFNVADSAITVGACCLAWGLHLEDKRAAR